MFFSDQARKIFIGLRSKAPIATEGLSDPLPGLLVGVTAPAQIRNLWVRQPSSSFPLLFTKTALNKGCRFFFSSHFSSLTFSEKKTGLLHPFALKKTLPFTRQILTPSFFLSTLNRYPNERT
ncbi:hypothetical protein ACD591_09185 [Rufibacter glacialis]|uniref:Uncharacterized protein n=1 Tax=Rufibacter glacialis TaxID=1259555 RepID=A0A5M8QBR4_9BACT|nr:hypothetical protein FOE74_14925 [Rufibacter glacialis]